MVGLASWSLPQRPELFVRQAPPVADWQIADAHRPYTHAHQFQHLAAHRFDHPPHLAIATLRDGRLQASPITTRCCPRDAPWHIGKAVQEDFEAWKVGTSFANGVKVAIDAKGLGDKDARAELDAIKKAHPGGHLTNKQIDSKQGGFRGAFLSLKVIERLPDGDRPIYRCRQIFVFNLKKEKVPTNWTTRSTA